MRFGSALVSWVLGQIESVPIELLRADRLGGAPMRILDAVYGEQEAEEVRAMLNRPAADGQHLFRLRLGCRQKACPESGRRDNRLANHDLDLPSAVTTFGLMILMLSLLSLWRSSRNICSLA